MGSLANSGVGKLLLRPPPLPTKEKKILAVSQVVVPSWGGGGSHPTGKPRWEGMEVGELKPLIALEKGKGKRKRCGREGEPQALHLTHLT